MKFTVRAHGTQPTRKNNHAPNPQYFVQSDYCRNKAEADRLQALLQALLTLPPEQFRQVCEGVLSRIREDDTPQELCALHDALLGVEEQRLITPGV